MQSSVHTRSFRQSSVWIAVALLVTLASVHGKDKEPTNIVLRIARAYPDGGGYSVKWTGSGTPEEIRHNDTRILAKCDADGTYCSGFTFAVAMRAAGELGLLKDKSVEDVKKFQKSWYGNSKDQDTRERQCAVAVEQLGIGKAIELKDARPGDFCQIWRSDKSGHSVVFLEWVEENGKRVGLKYRSSQNGTKGIGDRTEYFSDAEGRRGKVLRDRTYFARLNESESGTTSK
jgi:hypothetical protein